MFQKELIEFMRKKVVIKIIVAVSLSEERFADGG